MLNLIKGLGMLLDSFTGNLQFLNPIVSALQDILIPILIVVSTAGMIYAVVLGVNMARAENAEARAEAKKRVINAVVALAIMIILILLLKLFSDNLEKWVGGALSSSSAFIHLL